MFNKIARWFYDQRAFWLIALVNSFLWSWLFLIDDAKLSNNAFTGYLTITIVYLIIVFISTTCFWYAIKYLQRDIKKSKNPLIIAKIFFVWAFVELAVSWLVTIVWIGRNGTWTTILPFSTLTPWLMWTPLRFISRYAGFYGVSASVVTLIFILANKKLRKYALAYSAIIFLLTLMSWRLYGSNNGNQTKVTIVAEQLGQPKRIPTNGSSLIVFPEYGLDNFNSKVDINNNRLLATNPVYFVGSQQLPTAQGHTNTLVFGSSSQGITSMQSKSRLIPGGEYLAFPGEILLRAFAKNTYTNFEVTRAVAKGNDKPKTFYLDDNITLGSAACSSIISTEDYRSLVNQGATLLTNSASLDIFRGSRLFNIEHRGLAKFMAVANARTFLQSSNNWPAFALDKNGNKIAEIQPVGNSTVTVVNNKAKTPYTILGEWVAYIGGIWLVSDFIAVKLRDKKNRKS